MNATPSPAAATTVAALYACDTGPYCGMAGVDVWNEARDARNYAGPFPIVAHPPCAPWSFMRVCRLAQYRLGGPAFGKDPHKYTDCGPRAVESVQQFGGVLEHPAFSSLWAHCNLPRPGMFPDKFGGLTVEVYQCAWGHLAPKRTWLYLVRVDAGLDLRTKTPTSRTVESLWSNQRHLTPPAFAVELVRLARSVTAGVIAEPASLFTEANQL